MYWTLQSRKHKQIKDDQKSFFLYPFANPAGRDWKSNRVQTEEKRHEKDWVSGFLKSVGNIQKFKLTIRQSRIVKSGIKLSEC